MAKTNAFEELLNNLKEGKLNHLHIQAAYRAWIRGRKDIPDPLNDLLTGKNEAFTGLIYKIFKVMTETIGSMELAYRRGYQAGEEDTKKKKRKTK